MPMLESIWIIGCLSAAMLLGLAGRKWLALIMTSVAMLSGISWGISGVLALVSLSLLVGLLEWRQHSDASLQKGLLTVVVALLAVTLGMHVVDGFGSISLGTTRFGLSEQDYVFRVSLDKWAVGAVILAYAKPLSSQGRELFLHLSPIRRTMLVTCLPVVLISAGFLSGVPVDVKWSTAVLAFVAMNFFVCATEEGFYRLLVQERLHSVASPMLAWVLSGAVFWGTHYSPAVGLQTSMVFLLAGLIYAFTYTITRSLKATILVHWASNTLHILLLRYPL